MIKVDRNGFLRCRVCGCTEVDACPGGCGWVSSEEDLCTTCGDAVRALLVWIASTRRGNVAGLLREVKANFRPRKVAKGGA
jgi:hypothetical protein